MNRLAWAGQVVCKNNDRVIKKIFSTKPKGVKTAGRPKLRLEEGMSEDMKTLVSRTGRMLPATETNGRKFLRRPRPTKGCRANDDGNDDKDLVDFPTYSFHCIYHKHSVQ